MPHARMVVKAVVAKLHIHLVDYIIRGSSKSYTCNPEASLSSLPHSKGHQEVEDET